MKNNTVIGLFSAVIALQLAVPSSMLLKREMALQHGQEFRFKTAPVDPYDAFRGRYVALRADAGQGPKVGNKDMQYGSIAYAQIGVDDQGYAKIVQVSGERPKNVPYIAAKVTYQSGDQVNVNLPIDRYYMEEKAAPKAEQLYLRSSRQTQNDTYINVRIKDGFAVIEGLYINGQRIEEAVRNTKT